jgi:hypothetical protein
MRFHRRPVLSLLPVALALATALPAVAQTAGAGRKVTVGGAPTPGQTIRLNIVQDADMTMKPSAAAAGSPMPSMHMKQKTIMVVSQKVATPDAKGAIGIQLTYEDISQEMTINDQPPPPEAAAALAALKGKSLAMTVGASGELLEVVPPPDFPLPAELMKEMLKQALGLMPRQEMGVGETVTAPFQMAMPIPMPGGEPPQLKGELKTTLTGVTGAVGSEIAALAQVVTAAVDATMPSPGGNGELTIKMQMKGTGTTDWDVKGAAVKAQKMTTEITGTITVPGVGDLEMTGTTVVDLSRLP